MRLWLFRALFQQLHFVQTLLTGISHASGGNSGLVPLDKVLFLGNLSLLPLIGCILLPALDSVHFLEFLIAASISGQGSIFHMVDNIGNSIQERHIMGYQNKGILIALQIGFQPFNMLHIQEVSWLVQNQYIWTLQQQLGQQNLGALSPRKGIYRLVQTNIPQAQSSSYLLDFAVQGVEAVGLQNILNIPHISHHFVHFLWGSLSHFVIGRQHFLLQLIHFIKGCFQHITNGHARLKNSMLIQIASGYSLGPFYLALVWCHLPSNNG